MSYSPHLSYYLDRLSGFSSQWFELQPLSQTTASANSTIHIQLPTNSLVDVRSLAMRCKAQITDATDEGRLPPNIKSLIRRIEVEVNGTPVNSGNNYYNVLEHVKTALGQKKVCPALEHKHVVRANSIHKNSLIANKKEGEAKYVMSNFEEFLGTVQPSIIDTGLLGQVHIKIQFAENETCIDASGTTLSNFIQTADGGSTVKYSLSDITFMVQTIGMADGTYNSMVSSMMSQQGYLEMPFVQYQAIEDVTSTTMRFSVATQCLNRVFMVFRDPDYAAGAGAIAITGHPTSTNATSSIENVAGADYSDEKYTSRFFNFKEFNDGQTVQVQMNGSVYPNFQAGAEDWLYITKKSLEHPPSCEMNYGLRSFKDNYNIYCARFNLEGSEQDRVFSGLDTRGLSLNSFIKIQNGGGTPKPLLVLMELHSSLIVKPGQMVEVIS